MSVTASVMQRRILTSNLRTALATATGRPWGSGKAPVKEPKEADYPYGILYVIDGGGYSGPPFHHPEADADCVYQLTSVGLTVSNVEFMADKARTAILGRDENGAFATDIPAPEGWIVNNRRPDTPPGGVDQTGKDLYQVVERFVLSVTPA
jgi:hypothetical protein